MRIGSRDIGVDHPPYIIAELSANHGGSLATALDVVRAAAAAGAAAIKLQTYRADTMTLDIDRPEFRVNDPNSLWHGRQLFDLYKEAHTPWEWHAPIFELADELGLAGFSSPFDASAVELLEGLGVPAYKIASFEVTDLALIRLVAATGKPVIISTGMATGGEIEQAVSAARGAGCEDLALLKCTSAYPASPSDSNVLTIPHLRQQFDCEVGLSDHTMGIGAAVAAVAHGASIIEKHITLDREDGGVDSAFSLQPDELASLVTETERARQALGGVHYGPTDADRPSLAFRRSLYIVEDLGPGDVLTDANVRALRPGHGISPARLDDVLGLRVVDKVERGTPLRWELVRST